MIQGQRKTYFGFEGKSGISISPAKLTTRVTMPSIICGTKMSAVSTGKRNGKGEGRAERGERKKRTDKHPTPTANSILPIHAVVYRSLQCAC